MPIGAPRHVWRRRPELAVHAVERTRSRLVGDRRPELLAQDHIFDPRLLHHPRHRAARHVGAFPAQLPPDLAHAADAEGGLEHALDLGLRVSVTAGTRAGSARSATAKDADASRRISLACLSFLVSRARAVSLPAVSVGMPPRRALSTSARLSRSFGVCPSASAPHGRSSTKPTGSQTDRRPAALMPTFVGRNHPHRAVAHFIGVRRRRRLARDAPSRSHVEASGKPGAVQTVTSQTGSRASATRSPSCGLCSAPQRQG